MLSFSACVTRRAGHSPGQARCKESICLLIRVIKIKTDIVVPEYFTEDYRYQLAAQPYLAAIAHGVKDYPASRAFLLRGTEYAQSYESAEPLWLKQLQARGNPKCPFSPNYW